MEDVLSQVNVDDDQPQELPCRVELSDGHDIKTPMTVTPRNGSIYSLQSSQWIVSPISDVPDPADPGYTSGPVQSTQLPDYLQPNRSSSYLGLETPILALSYASFDLAPGDHGVSNALPFNLCTATECVIDLCFADYTVTVTTGQPTVSATRTEPATQFRTHLPDLWLHPNLTTAYHCWRHPDTPESQLRLKSIYNSSYSLGLGTCGLHLDTYGRGFCIEVGDSLCYNYLWAKEISNRLSFNVRHE